MGAQWKQAGRVENALKRGQLIGKIVKEILVAAKMGDPDPDLNARLRAAVEAARKASVPRDTIERAIKKGSGQTDDQIHYETITYEGFAPAKVPVIVECLTDNKNRTASDIRVLFKKGHLGAIGSVTWMFDRLGVVEAHHPDKKLDIEAAAIEAGADNVEPVTSGDVPEGHVAARFICAPTNLDSVAKYLADQKWIITTSELSYLAKNFVELGETEKKEVTDFLNAIDEHDDVHRIYTALKS
ncbi:MAG: YebC/PmpR family DNA-binding transcriptional regulator [Verrucomicrobiota bacterium]|nr:YebC/PmpR family DNA-binding transcriptional regulator [Verrucomicrobiota bacterium]